MADNEKPVPPSAPVPPEPPHAEAVELPDVDDPYVDFGSVADIHEGASGIIPLADLPDPSSSQSLTSWTAVIRAQREAMKAGTGLEPVVDSPSDHDMIVNMSGDSQSTDIVDVLPMVDPAEAMEGTELATEHDLVIFASDDAERPSVAGPPSSSIDFERMMPRNSGRRPDSSGGGTGSQIRFDVLQPPSDAGGSIPKGSVDDLLDVFQGTAGDVPTAEVVDDDPEAFALTGDDDGVSPSMVNLGGSTRGGSDAGRSSILDELLGDSGFTPDNPFVELRKTPAPAPNPPFVGLPTPVEIDEGSGVDATSDRIATRPSEDAGAIDLYADFKSSASISDSGSLQIPEHEMEAALRKEQILESSRVDLASSPGLSSRFDMDPETPQPIDVRELSGLGQYSGISRPPSRTASGPLTDDDIDIGAMIDLSVPDGGEQGSMIVKPADLEAEAARVKTTVGRKIKPVARPQSEDDLVIESAAEEEPAAPSPAKRTPPRRAAEPPRPSGEPKPANKSGGGRLLAGSLLGVLVAGGGFVGAWQAGLVQIGEERPTPQTTDIKPPGPTAVAAAVTPDAARAWLDAGDPAKALEAFEKLDGEKPAVQAGRGQSRWLAYLQGSADKAAAPDRNAEPVKKAVGELKAAGDKWKAANKPADDAPAVARATLWLGLIEETLGNPAEAVKVYDAAAKDIPGQEGIFQAAKARLQVLQPAVGEPVAALPLDRAFLAFVVLLQADPPQPAEGKLPTEAGFRFWDALLLANEHKYAEAKKAVGEAKSAHLANVAKKPGRGLNPLSDPREQIFPRCCDDLVGYWTLRESIYGKPGAAELVKAKGFEAAVESFASAGAKAKTLEADIKAAAEKLMLAADGKLIDGIDALLKAKKEADDAKKVADDGLAALVKALKEAAGGDAAKPEDALKILTLAKADAEKKGKELIDLMAKAEKAEVDYKKQLTDISALRDDKEALVKAIAMRLEKGKFVPENAGKEALLKGVDDAVKQASTDAAVTLRDELAKVKKDLDGLNDKYKTDIAAADKRYKDDIGSADKKYKDDLAAAAAKAKKDLDEAAAKSAKEIDAVKAQLALAKSPAQVLDVWLAALGEFGRPAVAAGALPDADAVLASDKVDDLTKVKAQCVKAFALRNQGEFAKAKAEFDAATASPAFVKDSAWGKECLAAAAALGDPAAFLAGVPAKERLAYVEKALAQYGAEAAATDHAKLLILRGELKLDANPAGAQQDAAEAAKLGGGAAAKFLEGQAAEKQGRWSDAASAYEAVTKDAGETPLGRKALLRLANAIRQQMTRPAGKPPEAPATGMMMPRTERDWAAVLTLMLVLAEPPASTAELDRLIELGNKLIAAKEYLGHIVKADALAKLGKYNEALREYSEGIKNLKALPAEYDGVLENILKTHPALKAPESVGRPEPRKAARAFDNGYGSYFNGRLDDAEAEFTKAIRADEEDARFHYFLGLTLVGKGDTASAEVEFTKGRGYELQGKPSGKAISESLERIQGGLRQVVNRYRP